MDLIDSPVAFGDMFRGMTSLILLRRSNISKSDQIITQDSGPHWPHSRGLEPHLSGV